MSVKNFGVNNTLVQLVMTLKMQQLNRGEMPTLRYEDLEDFLAKSLWKNGNPYTLHEATEQIMAVDASSIVRFLSRQAIYNGANEDLSDFMDLIGGN